MTAALWLLLLAAALVLALAAACYGRALDGLDGIARWEGDYD